MTGGFVLVCFVCVCVYIYIYMYVCMYVCIYVYEYMCVSNTRDIVLDLEDTYTYTCNIHIDGYVEDCAAEGDIYGESGSGEHTDQELYTW